MRIRTLIASVMGVGLIATLTTFPQTTWAATAPDLEQTGFPQVIASRTINPTAGPTTITEGNITVTIPTGAFGTSPVTFDLLQGPVAQITPSGTSAVTDWAFKVVNSTTGTLVGQFSKPVTVSVTAPTINTASEYWNVSPTGALALNPIAPAISGHTLTHQIAAAAVGWVVADPLPATNFTQHGFPQVVASTSFTPGTQATVAAHGIHVAIPSNAFNIPVTVQLLQGPTSSLNSSQTAGQRIITDFALKVIDPATHQLISTFNAPVVAQITSKQIQKTSQYLDVLPTGVISANPIPPTIHGDVMTHAIKAAAVGWVVTTPVPPVPDFTQHGFPTVIGTTHFTPGTAAQVSANGIHIAVPANGFSVPVTVQLLQGPVQRFASSVPSGQSVVTDFALKVTNTETHQLVLNFNAPIIATMTASQINAKSAYLDVSPTGVISANPIPPTIHGDVMTHAIKAAAVGWVITSPSVPKATAPVTGLPLAPMMVVGGGLIVGGLGLLGRRSSFGKR